VQLADELQANGSAMWQTRAGMRYQDRWRFPAAPADAAQLRYAHHEFSMFRYAEIIFTDAATGVPVDIALNGGGGGGGAQGANASFWRVRYPYDESGAARVDTSSADLDAVFELCRATLAYTSIDIYSDSNSRQRSFDCMADDTTAALSQYATTPELALPRFQMRQVLNNKLSQPITAKPPPPPLATPPLAPPPLAPPPASSFVWVDWTTLPGLNVVNDALFTGDLRFGERYFDELAANFTWARAIDATGLAAGVGALIDTSGGGTDGFTDSAYNSIGNAWIYLGLRQFAQLGRWLGRNATAAQLDATADALQAAFVAKMWNGSAVCDGVCAHTPHTSAHASFYAAMSGIMDGAAGAGAAALPSITAFLLDGIARGGELGMPGGSYSAQFLLQGLYRDGADHGNAAFAVLTSRARHSWLHMMEALGATATTECWLPEELPNLSFSHVWSSSPGSAIPQLLFGLLPTSPGFATLDIVSSTRWRLIAVNDVPPVTVAPS
jgi:alpha-L-rhamnosidase